MDRAYTSGSAGSAPTAPASPSIGYPTAGNPGTATPATKPGPWWYHMITEELRKVIVDAGLTPDHTNLAQLSAAIQALASVAASTVEIAAFSAVNKFIRPDRLPSAFPNSLASSGYQILPGGLIIQWGKTSSVTANGSQGVTFPVGFPANCFTVTTANQRGSSTQTWNETISAPTTTGFTIYNTDGTAEVMSWIAIGN